MARSGTGRNRPLNATPPKRKIIARRRWSVIEAPEMPSGAFFSNDNRQMFSNIIFRRASPGQQLLTAYNWAQESFLDVSCA